jgi:hypothetical protein
MEKKKFHSFEFGGYFRMNTIQEIEASLLSLNTDELHHIERVIHNLYRVRNEPVIYDDVYGIWTEYDQTSAALEVFELLDKQEDIKRNANA